MDVSVKMRVSHVTLLFPCSMPLYYGARRPRSSLYEYFANNSMDRVKINVSCQCAKQKRNVLNYFCDGGNANQEHWHETRND